VAVESGHGCTAAAMAGTAAAAIGTLGDCPNIAVEVGAIVL
jgi:hypothetical protein